MEVFTLDDRQTCPLVVSMPHSGTCLSAGLASRLTEGAAALPDTDWYIPELYDFLPGLGASVIQANHSRYVVDLNRNPDATSLYPDQATTELVPTRLFDGQPIYQDGEVPGEEEVRVRLRSFFDPYHTALSRVVDATVDRHGYALLWDAHSIAPVIPRLFRGTLPDLSLGSDGGRSCAAEIESRVVAAMMDESGYTHVANGRFRGGWITRHYGRPERHVHALQMELSQATYLTGAPPRLAGDGSVAQLRTTLRRILQVALDAAAQLHGGDRP